MWFVKPRTLFLFILFHLAAFVYNPMPANERPVDRVDPSTVKGKFMMGYQGWFFCKGDGQPLDGHHGWLHWIDRPLADGGRVTFDLWPSTRELDDDELYEIPGLTIPADKDQSGSTPQPARLFSSRNPKTVNRHFRWMREHDLSGVFLQRFLSEVKNGDDAMRRQRDEVGLRVRQAAEKEGRVWAMMWDVSGVPADQVEQGIMDDWLHLLNKEKILESPSYLHEDGRPVIVIWGMGFAGRGHSPQTLTRLIRWLRQSLPSGVWIMAGTPTYWNQGIEDQDPNPEFLDLWKEMDAISPWAVGRFGGLEGADNYNEDKTLADLDIIADEDQDRAGGLRTYVPVVFPGFSWINLHNGPLNEISREGGRFLYRQLYNAQRSGVDMIYGAMFDEYDEATALMPAETKQSRVPTEKPFLSLDADGEDLPDDWYLRICSLAAHALRDRDDLQEEFPKQHLLGSDKTGRRHDEL